jgi:hypothetical protein
MLYLAVRESSENTATPLEGSRGDWLGMDDGDLDGKFEGI